MKIKAIYNSDNPLTSYATKGSAAMDLYANNDFPIYVRKGKVSLIPTGLHIELPMGYEAQVRGRSGLGLKGLCIPNGLGTIDSDYRGDIGMILTNITDTPFKIEKGMRIGQLVICKHETVELDIVHELSKTVRGNKGFGSTGI